jgi:hypothetical protein
MAPIRSTIASTATKLTASRDVVGSRRAGDPVIELDSPLGGGGTLSVRVRNLQPRFVDHLRQVPEIWRRPRSIFRVRVVDAGFGFDEELPDVVGRYELLPDGLRFIPHFPFDPGVRYRVTFDAEQVVDPSFPGPLTLEFALAFKSGLARSQVSQVYPSSDVLPENLLRFYVCFSGPMQRGWAEQHINVLGSDGRPAPDVLYRPPTELWDRDMTCLTVLLDPGRLKRGVGPNRELGPPLRAGQEFALLIEAGMVDSSGRRLEAGFCKPFHVTRAVRTPLAPGRWKILPPAEKSLQPLEIVFPAPLDWAQLWHAITVIPEDGPHVQGEITINQGERCWTFTPKLPWKSGPYRLSVSSGLEDVCGNTLLAAFDRPLRSQEGLGGEAAPCFIPFSV